MIVGSGAIFYVDRFVVSIATKVIDLFGMVVVIVMVVVIATFLPLL